MPRPSSSSTKREASTEVMRLGFLAGALTGLTTRTVPPKGPRFVRESMSDSPSAGTRPGKDLVRILATPAQCRYNLFAARQRRNGL